MEFYISSPKFGVQKVLIDDEDKAKVQAYSWYPWSTPRHSGIYVVGYVPGERHNPVKLHRYILGAKKGSIVDHINGNPLDNRKCNLRIVSSSVNNQNARKRRDGITSSFKGVSWYAPAKKWKAQTNIKGKRTHIGYFKTEKEAAQAYMETCKINGIVVDYYTLSKNP